MTPAYLTPAAPRWPVLLALASGVLAVHLWWLLGPLPLGAFTPPAAEAEFAHPPGQPQEPRAAAAAATPAARMSAHQGANAVRVSTVRWIAPTQPLHGNPAHATVTTQQPAATTASGTPLPPTRSSAPADSAARPPAGALQAHEPTTHSTTDVPTSATAPALTDPATESPADTLLANATHTATTPIPTGSPASAAPVTISKHAAASTAPPPPAGDRPHPPPADAALTAAVASALPSSPPGALATTDQPASGVAPPAAARAMALPKATVPPSAELLYDISAQAKGLRYNAEGRLLWQTDGNQYRTELSISAFLLGSRVQTSRGQISAGGLEPDRFGDRRRSTEKATHFDRTSQRIRFSNNAPDAALSPAAQDRLSVVMQLASLLNAQPLAYPEGTLLSLLVAGTGSAEPWPFLVGALQTLALPAGPINARLLTREPRHEHDHRIELWLAPEWQHLPVRIRLTEADGSQVDQRLRALPPGYKPSPVR